MFDTLIHQPNSAVGYGSMTCSLCVPCIPYIGLLSLGVTVEEYSSKILSSSGIVASILLKYNHQIELECVSKILPSSGIGIYLYNTTLIWNWNIPLKYSPRVKLKYTCKILPKSGI